MKTFFGFMTGLLSGIIIGILGISTLLVVDERFREYCNDVAEDI